MNIKTIETLKQSATDFQKWIDNGFEELDETDTYPSDLFHAVATPKNIFELIRQLDFLKSELEESKMYQEAVLKELYNKLGMDYSDGELRFKWASIALNYKLRELESLKAHIDSGVRVTANLDQNPDYNGWFAHEYGPCNATLILDDGVKL